jgi:hypothetical protein
MGGDVGDVGVTWSASAEGVRVGRRRWVAGQASSGAGWRCDDPRGHGELCSVAARTPPSTARGSVRLASFDDAILSMLTLTGAVLCKEDEPRGPNLPRL